MIKPSFSLLILFLNISIENLYKLQRDFMQVDAETNYSKFKMIKTFFFHYEMSSSVQKLFFFLVYLPYKLSVIVEQN